MTPSRTARVRCWAATVRRPRSRLHGRTPRHLRRRQLWRAGARSGLGRATARCSRHRRPCRPRPQPVAPTRWSSRSAGGQPAGLVRTGRHSSSSSSARSNSCCCLTVVAACQAASLTSRAAASPVQQPWQLPACSAPPTPSSRSTSISTSSGRRPAPCPVWCVCVCVCLGTTACHNLEAAVWGPRLGGPWFADHNSGTM